MRQDPRLYSVFAQILRDPKLTVSLDRVSMKIPAWIEIEKNNQIKVRPYSVLFNIIFIIISLFRK